LIDVAPDGGLDHAHDLWLLAEEIVVLGRTGSVVDDDGVLVGHVGGSFWGWVVLKMEWYRVG
jgi:hypothetical protein